MENYSNNFSLNPYDDLSANLFGGNKEVAEKYDELVKEDALSHNHNFDSPDIFLSYSHDNKEIVEKIAKLLKEDGFSCWIDSENLRTGDKYNSMIFNAISNCRVFLVFLSKNYVNKKYCPLEFAWAQYKDASILAITLDDVNENTNKSAAYMFPYVCGETDPGYGKNISTDEDAAFIANDLKGKYQLQCMKAFYKSGDPNDLPKIKIPETAFSMLIEHNKNQYKQDGNYALNDIKGELFPAIKDLDADVLYKDDTDTVSSLIKYIKIEDDKCERRNLFLFGDGGMGKTVTLLKTADYLLDNGIPAIYVPLSKINTKKTVEDYLKMNVCNGMGMYWRILRDTMSFKKGYAPSVVLLLDGVNELPADKEIAKSIIKDIKEEFIDGYKGVDLIITSRWFDTYVLSDIDDKVIKLEMQQLDSDHINKHLESIGAPSVNDKKMLSVLSTPLFLSLYADVEKHKDKYKHIRDIKLIENPDTPGKILQNFFQTQLFRAAEEKNFDRVAHYVLLDYMLPEIAYRMTRKQNQNMVLSFNDEIKPILYAIQKNISKRYDWYVWDVLVDRFEGIPTVNLHSLITIAKNLHFLHETEDGYSLHQSFRDYFAACHIKNEMLAFCTDRNRKDDVSPVLEEACFDDDILKFVSDLVREEESEPVKVDGGWELQNNSKTEQLLDLWRDAEGEKAQNAVYNLFSIMRIGRKNQLFGCDFSKLDLRKCKLVGNIFVEWENNNIYTCKFDEAWINYSSFVTDGHNSPVTALCTDGQSLIFSGDENGTVKVFDIEAHKCIKTLELNNGTVADLSWHNETKRLAIMYNNFIYIYSFEDGTYETKKNDGKFGDFRYVGFDENGELTVAYSLEPLTLKNLSGDTLPSIRPEFQFDVPAKCAKWNPQHTEFARSGLFQSISLAKIEKSKIYIHPSLQSVISEDKLITEQEHIDARSIFEESKRNKDINYPKIIDDKKQIVNSYLVNTERILYVYNANTKRITHKKVFNRDISKIYNYQGQINVVLENISIVLKPNLDLNGAFLKLIDTENAKSKTGVNSMEYSDDGNRLLIGIQNLLIELETQNYTVTRKKEFNSNVGSVCYSANQLIVSSGAKIHVLNDDFSEKAVFDSANTAEIKSYIVNHDSKECYIASQNGTIKKLNSNLVVQRIRQIPSHSKFIWAEKKQDGKQVFIFSKMPDFEHGAAYDFDSGTLSKPLCDYKLIDRFISSNVQYDNYYNIDNQFMAYKRTQPFEKICFKNYNGVNIYGCSFLNIKGDIAEQDGINFIYQNGGIINGI